MDDASGRYTTGWYWGNHYWAGSRTLCENIAPDSKKFSATSRQLSPVNLTLNSSSNYNKYKCTECGYVIASLNF